MRSRNRFARLLVLPLALLAATALVPLSFVIVGPLADWAGVRPVMIGCGVLGLVFTVAAFLLPGMRETEGKVSLGSG